MTALPLPPQRLPLTVADYVALGEDPDGVRYELQEGALVMAVSPIPEHQRCILRLGSRLRPRCRPISTCSPMSTSTWSWSRRTVPVPSDAPI